MTPAMPRMPIIFTRYSDLLLAAHARALALTEAQELTCLACVLEAWRAHVCAPKGSR